MIKIACPGAQRGRPCGGKLYHLFHNPHFHQKHFHTSITYLAQKKTIESFFSPKPKKQKPVQEDIKNTKKKEKKDMAHLVKTSYEHTRGKGHLIYLSEKANEVYPHPSLYNQENKNKTTEVERTCPLCGSNLQAKPEEKEEEYSESKAA